MAKHKQHRTSAPGFTIIEVTLVLALSMFLFVGIIGGTNVNIVRQRYNDSVQSFAEFLRSQYAEVISTENPRTDRISGTSPCTVTSITPAGESTGANVETGRSNCLIYGKLITFGEYTPSSGTSQIIYSYDVVGDAVGSRELSSLNSKNNTNITNETLRSLINVNADILTARRDTSGGTCRLATAGTSTSYQLEWGAYVQTTGTDLYKGSILIVRSPLSGAISTFHIPKALPAQTQLSNNSSMVSNYCNANNSARVNAFNGNSLRTALAGTGANAPTYGSTSTGYAAEFCINSDDVFALANSRRRMVSIAYDGYNASAVKIADQDSEDNRCN